jgi:hypothetical protein
MSSPDISYLVYYVAVSTCVCCVMLLRLARRTARVRLREPEVASLASTSSYGDS